MILLLTLGFIYPEHVCHEQRALLSDRNPFTASACKIFGMKSAHIHASANRIFSGPLYKSTFDIVRFDRDPFRVSHKARKKMKGLIKAFKPGTFMGRLQVTSWQ